MLGRLGFSERTPSGTKWFWKVPFRSKFCDSFRGMLKSTVWCHLVLRLFPNVVDLDQGPLDREHFLKHYEFALRRVEWSRVLRLGPSKQHQLEAATALEMISAPECPYKYGYR